MPCRTFLLIALVGLELFVSACGNRRDEILQAELANKSRKQGLGIALPFGVDDVTVQYFDKRRIQRGRTQADAYENSEVPGGRAIRLWTKPARALHFVPVAGGTGRLSIDADSPRWTTPEGRVTILQPREGCWGPPLYLAVSRDGSIAMLAHREYFIVFSTRDGAIRFSQQGGDASLGPDGRRIAFRRMGFLHLMIDGNLRNTREPQHDVAKWSPDGEYVFFGAYTWNPIDTTRITVLRVSDGRVMTLPPMGVSVKPALHHWVVD